MSLPSDPNTMTLAGLAEANGPWLAVRLRRLAEHAGQPLPGEVVEGTVLGCSGVLGSVLEAEGRPLAGADPQTDPIAALGREQALALRQAGLDMVGSVRLLRLLRRAYDDLVRESWVERDSRARAHEDVERFFERMLIGHVTAWASLMGSAGSAPPPQNALAETDRLTALVAQREDELQRVLEAARAASRALRQAQARTAAQAGELAQAKAWAESQVKVQEALKAELAAAQAQPARQAGGEDEAVRAELRQLREAHAALASEAEAMRNRLSEAGSRFTTARRIEEDEIQARLSEAAEARQQAQERAQALEEELRQSILDSQAQRAELTAKLSEQESQAALQDERLREQAQALAETQGLLARLGAAKDEIQAEAEALTAERDALSAELARLALEARQAGEARDQYSVEAQALCAERDALQVERDAFQAETHRLGAEAEASLAKAGERLAEAETRLAGIEGHVARLGLERDACARLLATHLELTPDAVAAVDTHGGFTVWNARFPVLFGLADETLSAGLSAALPLMARALQRPEAFVARMHELLADPALAEDGLTLCSARGETLVFRSKAASGENGAAGRLFNFRDESLEHDMENLVREIEGITRYELGASLTAFIHLPQELLDEPNITPEQAEKLTVVRDSGYRIVNTVNMAVDIFRMERGLYRPVPGRTLDLAVVARRAVKDVSPLAQSRHVDLELLLNQSPLPQDFVLPGPGDPILAHGLSVNLLRDALEAAPRQSMVQAVLREDDSDNCLRLDITREGGLSPDEQARYFDKPVGSEAGDGLKRARYAAMLIAGSLGGSLAVGSSSGSSTTLSLRLPKGAAGG